MPFLEFSQKPSKSQGRDLAAKYNGSIHELYGKTFLQVSSQALPTEKQLFNGEPIVVKTEFQLSSRDFKKSSSFFPLTDKVSLSSDATLLIAGPCSVESYDQIMKSAEFMASLGIKVFRAGAFKPRTTPWKFQGLGEEGLRLLEQVREKFGLAIITEVRSGSHVKAVGEVADIIQIGAKAMYDHDILHGCGLLRKPVLLKRGFGSTVKELLLASDFILAGGNERVLLCFRGTRDFETSTRFSMDICGAARTRELSHLPMVIDPSHAVGLASLVPEIALAGAAMGPAALLIEVHPNPSEAKSDAEQALSHEVFAKLKTRLERVLAAVDKKLI